MSLRLKLHQLDHIAQNAGYPDYKSLLYDFYVVRQMSLTELGRSCHISATRVRKHLKRFGIPIRSKGGANNVKIILTDELIDEIARDGVPAVAERMGLSSTVFYTRLKYIKR